MPHGHAYLMSTEQISLEVEDVPLFLPGIGDASETGHKSRLGPGLGVNLYALEPGRVVVLVSHKENRWREH